MRLLKQYALITKPRGIGTMLKVLVAVSAACALPSAALTAETRNFGLERTRDLVALCSCPPEAPLYAQALQYNSATAT